MPDLEQEEIPSDEEEVELSDSGMTPAEAVVYWAPAGLFGFSVIFALLTVLLNPMSNRQKRKAPEEYYSAAVSALEQSSGVSSNISRPDKLHKLTLARTNLKRLIFHYKDDPVFSSGKFHNPYLLLADANRRLAALVVSERVKKLKKESLGEYSMALMLEDKKRQGEQLKLWNKQYVRDPAVSELFKSREIETRKKRRQRYILYQRAVLAFELGQITLARRNFEELRNVFFDEEMERLRKEKLGKIVSFAGDKVLPGDYELLIKDTVNLHYYLAMIYEKNALQHKAIDEYRVFLLQAPRSRERFNAKMRLAQISYNKAQKYIDESLGLGGERREAMIRKALAEFRVSADMFAEIVGRSAPEDILRKAYFWGGKANLAYASAMDVGRETSWDYVSSVGDEVKTTFENLSPVGVPERMIALPQIIGKSLLLDAGVRPFSSGGTGRFLLGSALTMYTSDRITPHEERSRRLTLARSYFNANSSGKAGADEYVPESRIMIGRSLLIEGRNDKARKVFRYAMKAYPLDRIKIAAWEGIGRSYLNEGRLDDAWKAFIFVPASSLGRDSELTPKSMMARDLVGLGAAYVKKADELTYPEEWLDMAPGSYELSEAIQRSRLLVRVLKQALKVYDRVANDYDGQKPFVDVRIAGLKARLGGILAKRPFGSKEDMLTSRAYRLEAADRFLSIAKDFPGSAYDEDALIRSGDLFIGIESYERAIEGYSIFTMRHGRSEQVGRVRNQLGLAYMKLGIFDKAEIAFRANAADSTTAEGRKGLYNLGKNYLLWAINEDAKDHLGGPGSPLLLSKVAEGDESSEVLRSTDIVDWVALINRLKADATSYSQTPARKIWEMLPLDMRERFITVNYTDNVPPDVRQSLLTELNRIIKRRDFYSEQVWNGIKHGEESVSYIRRGVSDLGKIELVRLNRLLIEEAFPDIVVRSLRYDSGNTIPFTAKEVFEYIRSLPGLGPESQPWRWSTFALGETLYRIAENEKRKSLIPPEGDNKERVTDDILRGYYQRAINMLVEAIDRYVLYPQHPDGVREAVDPKGYYEIKRDSFKSLYYLAMCYRALKDEYGMQRALGRMFDEDLYGQSLWAENDLLNKMHRNAYYFMGLSMFRTGNYEGAYETFERANDRIKNGENPYYLYMMGECLYAMDRRREARSKYIQARHAVRVSKAKEITDFEKEFGVEFWQKRNEERIADLEYLARAQGTAE